MVLAGRILLSRTYVGTDYVYAIMTQLQGDDRTGMMVLCFRGRPAVAHHGSRTASDLLVALTGIGGPKIVEASDSCFIRRESPLGISMVAPLYIIVLFGN